MHNFLNTDQNKILFERFRSFFIFENTHTIYLLCTFVHSNSKYYLIFENVV